ncbi:DUF2254 domain-containing protein [Pseudosulfitobacter sp. DSM 107133]|uniref:DUF2254 domain-containing protein n=1 Tax=Pseudosulfitobacter sp. DSM 107133 TaxID=2883100 RepID=UPI000DF3CFB7|nr:DUF2254 domain-containing protein [Pseudosulfitobacter sp. DSM 107133]UOA25426.1 hypothetical protein DSM107133_00098 [Pseudosulfitobacter sp. DSM 107133]
MFGSRAYVLKIAQDVRSSYWFIPSTLVFAALLLSELTQFIDHNPDVLPLALPDDFLDTQVDGARQTLAVIAQSIIGVTGVMFSITMVAVSFASGNFGPRLIGNFMRDRGNQVSLGILISSFVYALMILRAVQSSGADGLESFVPQYSMLVALLLTLLSVSTLIYFLHHIPETINVSNISAALGRRLAGGIERIIDNHADRTAEPVEVPAKDATATELSLGQAGYIQQLDLAGLCTLAEENDWVIDVAVEIGSFVSVHETVLTIHSASAPTAEQCDKLCSSFAVGEEQTEAQDITFMIDQLVEMAARALSPGVNDPFTAINCLNWLRNGISVALQHKGGLNPVSRPRVQYRSLTLKHLLDISFRAAAPYCMADKMARDHWMFCLRSLLDAATGDHKKTVAALLKDFSGD